MAQLAAVEGGLDGARQRAPARRGGVGRRDVSLDQERPPFFVRTLPDPHQLQLPDDADKGTLAPGMGISGWGLLHTAWPRPLGASA